MSLSEFISMYQCIQSNSNHSQLHTKMDQSFLIIISSSIRYTAQIFGGFQFTIWNFNVTHNSRVRSFQLISLKFSMRKKITLCQFIWYFSYSSFNKTRNALVVNGLLYDRMQRWASIQSFLIMFYLFHSHVRFK